MTHTPANTGNPIELFASNNPPDCRYCGEKDNGRQEFLGVCDNCHKKRLSKRKLSMDSRIHEMLAMANVPHNLRRDDLRFPKLMKPYLDPKRGLFLHGKAGRGKSQAMALLVKGWYVNWIKNEYKGESDFPKVWRFESVPALTNELQDSFNNNRSAYAIMNSVINYDYLILDDIGSEKVTEFVYSSMFKIIDQRLNKSKPTFFTSNLTLPEIESYFRPKNDLDKNESYYTKYGARIASRIEGMCDIIEIEGPDYRVQNKQQREE